MESKRRFPFNLHKGDEVFWNDPDGGASRIVRIVEIEYTGHGENCPIRIVDANGEVLECLPKELS